jgi:hypothetical protein
VPKGNQAPAGALFARVTVGRAALAAASATTQWTAVGSRNHLGALKAIETRALTEKVPVVAMNGELAAARLLAPSAVGCLSSIAPSAHALAGLPHRSERAE